MVPPSDQDVLDDNPYDDEENQSRYQQRRASSSKSRTPVLDNFGVDKISLAEENKLDGFIGRDKDIENISIVLGRRSGNSPIIIAPSPAYRQGLIDALAVAILRRKAPRTLFNIRIVQLDIDILLFGVMKAEQARERIQAIVNELDRARDIVLYIEDIHQLFLEHKDTGLDVVTSVLRNALTKKNIRIIGGTSKYNFIEVKDRFLPLKNVFSVLEVPEFSSNEIVVFIHKSKQKIEEFHNVVFSDESLNLLVDLCSKHFRETSLLDSAIDSMDEIAAKVHISNINTPLHIEELEKEIEMLIETKNMAVKNQQYERAADLREKESKLSRQLDFAKIQWEEESKTKRIPVDADDVYAFFQGKTGINKDLLEQGFVVEKIVYDSSDYAINEEYFKEKVIEYDLENKASFYFNGIHDYLKTGFQQYLLYFKDYLRKVKGKDLYFDVSKVEDGLRVDINPNEINDFEEINNWFSEYLGFIQQKNEEIIVNFEKELDEPEAELIMEELINQVKFLENQISLIEKQVKTLEGKGEIIKQLTISISDQQKHLIEHGYADVEAFKYSLKQSIGAGKASHVIEELLTFITFLPDGRDQYLDEIIIINSRLSTLDMQVRAGVMPLDSETIERQKINTAIIGLINRL